MARKRKQKKVSKLGMAPGSLVFTGVQKMENTHITLIQYNGATFTEQTISSVDEALSKIKSFDGNSWLNIDGLHDIKIIEAICLHFGVHKLTIEDILSVGQRPKFDDYNDYLHAVLKMFQIQNEALEDEQISFIVKNNLLLSFQERSGDVFEGVRKRLEEGKGYIRKRGTDYLLYALIDSVVDSYFVILENFGEKMEDLEVLLLDAPEKSVLNKLHEMRRETLDLRRSVYPLREVVNQFEKIEEPMVKDETKIFIRDLYDHTIQVIETIEVFRDSASGLLDLYMNSVSNKMNEIMKVLTIMASIFIPLTFIAGIYGMNFEYMPELSYKYSYFILWGVMILLFILMLIYFKKKKWL